MEFMARHGLCCINRKVSLLGLLSLAAALIPAVSFAIDLQRVVPSPAQLGADLIENESPRPQAPTLPGFAGGEIIVRFRTAEAAGLPNGTRAARAADLMAPNSVAELNRKHGLKRMDRLFPAGSPGALAKVVERRGSRAPRDARARAEKIEAGFSRTYKLTLTADADIAQTVRDYASDPNVEFAQPNYIHELNWSPNDLYYNTDLQTPPIYSWGQSFPDLWGIKKLRCGEAWDIAKGAGIVVAVVDTGVDGTHPELSGRMWTNTDETVNGVDDDNNGYIDDVYGWDCSDGDNNPSDYHGHGTHTSGTIAANGNNTIGVIGVAPLATIMPVKVFPQSTSENCAAGIRYAATNGADVLSNSWGAPAASDPVLEAAIDYAYALGCICVFAAGNANNDVVNQSPANYPKTIAVAATDYLDQKASFSCYGTGIDVSAPGVDVLSLRAAGTDMYGNGSHTVGVDYMRANGTSMACPHVSGAMALAWSAHPEWTRADVEAQVACTADAIDAANFKYVGQLGLGRINVLSAVTMSPQPNIVLKSVTVGDSEGDSDGLVDPGESVALGLSLKNHWLAATGVNATFSCENPYVTVIKDSHFYGDMASGAEAAGAFRFHVAPEIVHGSVIAFHIDITADGDYSVRRELVLSIPWPARPGWPKLVYPHAITPVDLDGDGRKEVLLKYIPQAPCNGCNIHLASYDSDGNMLSGWPVLLPAGDGFRDPSFGDIDGDGEREIVVCQDVDYDYEGQVYAFKRNGQLCAGWPVILPRAFHINQAALADIDPSTPGLEIVATAWVQPGSSMDRRNTQLYVLKGNGQILSGFPRDFGSNTDPGWSPYMGCTATADVDGDGRVEIIMASTSRSTRQSDIYAIDYRGFTKTGWPYRIPQYAVSAVIGDLDNNGSLEIVVGSLDMHIYVLTGAGQLWNPSWAPSTLPAECLSLGDLDGDDDLEIVCSEPWGSYMHAIHHDGSSMSGWPVNLVSTSPAGTAVGAIADLDGDGDVEISGSTRENIWVWHTSGLPLAAADPLAVGSYVSGAYTSFSSIVDLDNDGNMELTGNVTDHAGRPSVWTFPSSGARHVEWAMEGAGPERTGLYQPFDEPAGIHVEPWTRMTSVGQAGGPFAPHEKSYTVKNAGDAALDWSASKTQAWIDLSLTGGSLAPGQNALVVASINSGAAAMPQGAYTDTITFTNATSGLGNTTRRIDLTVKDAFLSVMPESDPSFTGGPDHPFTPSHTVYTVRNTGYSELTWTASASQTWINLSTLGGTLLPGDSATVVVSIDPDAATLPAGLYTGFVSFDNAANGSGNTTRNVNLTVVRNLSVTPSEGLVSAGGPEAEFNPASQTYVIANPGSVSVDWTASANQSWIVVSPQSGHLGVGENSTVMVSIDNDAGVLPVGSYSGTVTIANAADEHDTTTRSVEITVQHGILSVTPADAIVAVGHPGGALTIAHPWYVVSNVGCATLSWQASDAEPWLLMSESRGSLAPGASQPVAVSLGTMARSLPLGRRIAEVAFSNLTNGVGSTTRNVEVAMSAPVYVNKNAPGPVHDGTSWQTGFLTIQQGLDAAVPDQEVLVAAGAYPEAVVVTKNLILRGGYAGVGDTRNPGLHVTTVQAPSDVITAQSACVIDGFRVNGGAQGIVCSADSVVVINNTVTGASYAGVRISGENDLIERNVLNADYRGIRHYGVSAVISGNIISNSTSYGISLTGSGVIVNNTIYGNAYGESMALPVRQP